MDDQRSNEVMPITSDLQARFYGIKHLRFLDPDQGPDDPETLKLEINLLKVLTTELMQAIMRLEIQQRTGKLVDPTDLYGDELFRRDI